MQLATPTESSTKIDLKMSDDDGWGRPPIQSTGIIAMDDGSWDGWGRAEPRADEVSEVICKRLSSQQMLYVLKDASIQLKLCKYCFSCLSSHAEFLL